VTGIEVGIVWPIDVRETDSSAGSGDRAPGFLLAVLPDADRVQKAVAALRGGGFDERELRV
jgi:hypothetical protein